VARPLADTGLSVSDALVLKRSWPLADTAFTVSESLVRKVVRSLSDTGLSVTESIVRDVIRALSDTGLSLSDALAKTLPRALADTGLSVSDALALKVTRTLTDTGITVSDALVLKTTRSLTDTGMSLSDALVAVKQLPRALTDTGLMGTTNLVTNGGFETDTTGWLSSNATLTRTTAEANFGSASLSAVLGAYGSASIPIATTDGQTYTASVYVKSGTGQPIKAFYADSTYTIKAETDVSGSADWQRIVVSFTAAETNSGFIYISDNGGATPYTIYIDGVQVELGAVATPYVETDGGTATGSLFDALTAITTRPRSLADTGLSLSDTLVRKIALGLADTGLAIADSLTVKQQRALADTGLSVSDALVRKTIRALTDTGLAVSDSLVIKPVRPLTDTGATVKRRVDAESRALSQ